LFHCNLIKCTKVEEIKNNPYAYILLGYNETTNNSFVEIEANIEIVEDQKVIGVSISSSFINLMVLGTTLSTHRFGSSFESKNVLS
jgi:hypothetical protein